MPNSAMIVKLSCAETTAARRGNRVEGLVFNDWKERALLKPIRRIGNERARHRLTSVGL